MSPSRHGAILLACLLVITLCGSSAAQCPVLTPGITVSGQVEVDNPVQCYTMPKPPFTKEILMVDTAAFDIREGYYICTAVSGGAIGQGCSSDLRTHGTSVCLKAIDGLTTINVNVSCNSRDSLGCHALFSGKYLMNARWVFTSDECHNIMTLPSAATTHALPAVATFLVLALVLLLL